jgi:hypothetical protein
MLLRMLFASSILMVLAQLLSFGPIIIHKFRKRSGGQESV